VKAALAAVDAADGKAFLSAVAADAVVDEMIEREPFAGVGGAARWFEAWTRAVGGMRTEIALATGVGDWVLAETVVRGTLRATLGPLRASGSPFTVHRALAMEMRAGKVVRMMAFMNGKELAQATGQWPPAPSK
jgi:ketosteroid isomerase-like protein